MSRKTEVTAKNRSDRKSCPGAYHRGNRKTLPLRGNGRAKAPPALLPFPVAVLLSLPAIITGVLLVNFLSCSSVMAITRKQGRAMAPSAPGQRCCPVVEPHSARAAAAHPPGSAEPASGFGLTLGSDGEGQRLRLLRPCRPERLHRAG
jgi:hypothetical protein